MGPALEGSLPDRISQTFAVPSPIASPRWIEPDESLDPGEFLLGGSTSTNLSRGRVVGYGLYFTNRRIIGIKRKRIGQVILVTAAALGLAVLLIQFLLLHDPLTGFLTPLFYGVDPLSRYLTQKFGEKILSRADNDKSKQLRRKRDFEAKREEISAIHLGRTSKNAWRLDIVYKDPGKKEIRIKIAGGKHYQILRDLVDAFSRIQPTIYFREY
jgi:hypothetical protein